MVRKTYSAYKGFTLIETLVAITILLLIIIGPMTIAQKGIQNAYYAREQLTAIFLAQEAIEGLRMLRDNAALVAYESTGGSDNTDNWHALDCTSGNCAYNNDSLQVCGLSNNNCILKFKASTGEYAYSGTSGFSDSIYTRKIRIGSSNNGGVGASSTVSWTGRIFGNTTRSVVLQTWIYDHYERYEN